MSSILKGNKISVSVFGQSHSQSIGAVIDGLPAGIELDFEKIEASPIETGREELIKIKGVGKKVAECTLLYGFGKLQAFPTDVWVKRVVGEMYPNGLPDCIDGYDGIAQQYLFHWRRNGKEFM